MIIYWKSCDNKLLIALSSAELEGLVSPTIASIGISPLIAITPSPARRSYIAWNLEYSFKNLCRNADSERSKTFSGAIFPTSIAAMTSPWLVLKFLRTIPELSDTGLAVTPWNPAPPPFLIKEYKPDNSVVCPPVAFNASPMTALISSEDFIIEFSGMAERST